MPIEPDLGDLFKSLQDQINALKNRAQGTPGSSALQLTVDQLSANSDAATNVQSFVGSALGGTNQVVATVTLVKPAWATRCTVLATSAVTTNTVNQAASPLSGTMRTVIAGVASVAVAVDTKADDVYTTKVVPLSRAFDTSAAVVVDTQVTISGGAAANALSAQLAVAIFWYP